MNKTDRIDLILVFKKVIKALEEEFGVRYICNAIYAMDISLEIRKKAIDYLFEQMPTKDVNKTFYDHKYFNKEMSDSFDWHQNKARTWWIPYGVNEHEDTTLSYKEVSEECVRQRILFLRILIDKLNK